VVAEGDVQLQLKFWVLKPMTLHKPEERAIGSAVTENRSHLVALRQVIPGRSASLVKIHVVCFEDGVDIGALQIRTPFQKEIEEVPSPGTQGQVKRDTPLEIQPVPVLQQE
jgi:hypothetical protein